MLPGDLTPQPRRQRPHAKSVEATPCRDRAIEGLLQGALTGGVWGSFVALQARAQRPEPSAFRQVSRIGGGYMLGIGGLLALYNGASCVSQRARTSITSGAGQHTTASANNQSAVDALIGGFVAGFLVSIPMHYSAPAATAAHAVQPLSAASAAAAQAAPHSDASIAAGSAAGSAAAPAAPSSCSMISSRMSTYLRRVQWGGCGRYGAAMALVGVLMHTIAQPDGPALEPPRGSSRTMYSAPQPASAQ